MGKVINNKSVGIGVLSWNAHETLQKALNSYPEEFLGQFDQKHIYFSDISDTDKQIANHYNWDYSGGPNKGIAAGMKHLAENLHTDYILLLQNDNPLCERPDFARKHIKDAISLIEDGHADLARMRHRWKVGEAFTCVRKYLEYHDVKNISPQYIPAEHEYPDPSPKPLKKAIMRVLKNHNTNRFKGRCIYIENNPEEIYPEFISKNGDFLIADSCVLDFTDQCLLISRDKWLNTFVPYVEKHPSSRAPNGFQAPEICINRAWWRKNHFKILQGTGLFTHARYDGSFRPEHHTNEKYAKAKNPPSGNPAII